ncbi:hypothetical protein [Pseudonocardia acaciae]|uniref:hypothetical protein n=1 Tax=Pseudonocardia acaciae TaxID=551276 RepID=UPI00048AF08B|nr:hypothetical protein [Pseudonocardia acaciae]
MPVTGYAYPWDVLDAPGFLDRAAEIGVDEVAVALSYHTTRAATPWSPNRTSVLARHAALYRPVRDWAWGSLDQTRLRPGTPDWTGRDDPGGDAVRALREAGMDAAGWVVLTHNSRLGEANPDVCVRNCFDEPYPWALCPSSAEVRQFAATLAEEAVDGLELSSLVLEACGQLGAVHQCHHEKTDAVWSPAAARLLSVCCCAACAGRWTEAGAEPERITDELRRAVRSLIVHGDSGMTEDPLEEELAGLLLATRQAATDELRGAVLAAVAGSGARVVLHGAVDPWVTGALPGLTPAAAGDVDAVVLPCWQAGAATVDAVGAARERLPGAVRVGAYITAVAANPVPDIAGYVTELGKAGADELHLYHLGLAGPARWADMRAAATAARYLPAASHT